MYGLQLTHVHDDSTITTYSWSICGHKFASLLHTVTGILGAPRESLITGGHAESVVVPE